MRHRRRPDATVGAVMALCLSTGIAFSTPAGAAVTDDPSPSTAWSSDGGAENDEPLSAKTLEEQIAEADRLTKSLAKDNAKIADAVADLKEYSKEVNELLEAHAKARDEYEQAQREVDEAQRQLESYRERLSDGREDLRAWAFDTYTSSGGYSDTLTLLGALTQAPGEGGNSAGDITYLTDERIRSVDLMREDADTQADLTDKKQDAVHRASQAKNEAAAAKKEAEEVLEERRTSLDNLRKQHSEDLEEAGPVIMALIGVPDDSAQGASERLTEALEELGQDVSEFKVAEPCSNDTGSYPNGQIPPAALCPLLGAPGESLRPEAAAAFNTMSMAYQRDTGHLLCVTDSYRSYASQVVTKAARGSWAAAPGTSTHGLGKALDLCGGVNSFGHPAHLWMVQNAPLYGWFHPSWAAAGGSLPEPWHWEFSG